MRCNGPSLGSGARSFAPRGRGPRFIGPSTLPPGFVTTAFAGGGPFASGALHGKALAAGAKPIGRISPMAAVAASDTETKRGIADMSHLPRSETSH